MMTKRLTLILCAGALAAPTLSPTVHAAPPAYGQRVAVDTEQRRDAAEEVHEATRVVAKMQRDLDLRRVMHAAKGVFILPDYARAGLGIGGSGGTGVLLVRGAQGWGNPTFYNMGAVSFGLQAGVAAGQVGMLLMTDKSVAQFMEQNAWSLNADAGLNIVDWNERAQASWGKGDIVMWSDAEGAYLGASINLSDINFDEETTRAYYGAPIAAVREGRIDHAPPGAVQLKETLARS